MSLLLHVWVLKIGYRYQNNIKLDSEAQRTLSLWTLNSFQSLIHWALDPVPFLTSETGARKKEDKAYNFSSPQLVRHKYRAFWLHSRLFKKGLTAVGFKVRQTKTQAILKTKILHKELETQRFTLIPREASLSIARASSRNKSKSLENRKTICKDITDKEEKRAMCS